MTSESEMNGVPDDWVRFGTAFTLPWLTLIAISWSKRFP